jgi:hypothetical protein
VGGEEVAARGRCGDLAQGPVARLTDDVGEGPAGDEAEGVVDRGDLADEAPTPVGAPSTEEPSDIASVAASTPGPGPRR